ncbi:MAG: metalloregulator ArsR/SmtB family transcription factor [Planctomycetota bacterium]
MPNSSATRRPAARQLRLTELDALGEAAECLKVLAHPHRLRMLQMLKQADFTVGELAEACGVASHVASEHLRLMQRCGFLTSEKDGRRRYYRVAEPHLASILGCVEARFGVSKQPVPTRET